MDFEVGENSEMRALHSDWNSSIMTINQMPSPREVYWIGVFDDAVEPEFTGYHPGLIIGASGGFNERTGTVTFVPLTSLAPVPNASGQLPRTKYQLLKNPHPTDNRTVWAVCDHILTVRLTRLERYKNNHRLVVPKASVEDFKGILTTIIDSHVALRNLIEANLKDELSRLSLQYESSISALNDEHQKAIEACKDALLDEMTRPNSDQCT